MAYAVAERTREIGIRMALGADAGAVLALVARQALAMVAVGLILGLGGSFALTRVIKSALVGVTAICVTNDVARRFGDRELQLRDGLFVERWMGERSAEVAYEGARRRKF